LGARRQFVGEGDIPAVLCLGNLAKSIFKARLLRLCHNYINKELTELVSGHFALLGLHILEFLNSPGNTIVYHQASRMHPVLSSASTTNLEAAPMIGYITSTAPSDGSDLEY
jgi:hypothetical protein